MAAIPPVPFWFKTHEHGIMYRALQHESGDSYLSAASRQHSIIDSKGNATHVFYNTYPIHEFPKTAMRDVMSIHNHTIIPPESIHLLTPEEKQEMFTARTITQSMYYDCYGFFDGSCYWFYPKELLHDVDRFPHEVILFKGEVFPPPPDDELYSSLVIEALLAETDRRRERIAAGETDLSLLLTDEESDAIAATVPRPPYTRSLGSAEEVAPQRRFSQRIVGKLSKKKGGRKSKRKKSKRLFSSI